MSYRSNDYECPEHGRFDETVPRSEEETPQPCPECGQPSPWVFPAPMGRMALGNVVRGKSDGPRHHRDLTTAALADGMPLSEWKANRRKMWANERLRQTRQALS